MAGAKRRQTREPMDKNRIEGRCAMTSWHNTAKSSGLPLEVNPAAMQKAAIAAAYDGGALTGMAGAKRRQCSGATCPYLGNGSEADMDDRREPEGWSDSDIKPRGHRSARSQQRS